MATRDNQNKSVQSTPQNLKKMSQSLKHSQDHTHESDYDLSWCDDDRGPLCFKSVTYETDNCIPITQLTKEITKALEERKWTMQWNETEWRNLYYEPTYLSSSEDEAGVSDDDVDDVGPQAQTPKVIA